MIGALRFEPGQGGKAFAFMGLGLLLQTGLVLGITAGDSLFLSHVGPTGLPEIYILQTLAMLFYTAIFVVLVKRFGVDRVFDGALAVMILGGGAIWVALAQEGREPGPLLYYAVKLYTGVWYFGLYTLFWTFLDSYFDLTDAKRLYAMFAAGSAAGAMLGGGVVSLFAERISAGSFFLFWAGIALGTWPMLRWIRGRWRKIDVNDEESEERSAFRAALSGVISIGQSRYAVALTGGFFLVAVTATVCDYQYMRLFSLGRSEADLTALLGNVTLAANFANVLITLFLFNGLIARFGVRNVALLQPLAFGAVFVWFIGLPGLGAAVAGFLSYHGLMMAIDINNGNLLVFGLPAAKRKELRTFIEGICLPGAAAVTGLFLLFIAPGLGLAQVSMIGIVFAALSFAFNLVVRRDYAGAIAANLRAGWLDLSMLPPRGGPASRDIDARSIDALVVALHAGSGHDRAPILAMLAGHGAVAVGPLLLAAGDYSADERYQVEHLIVAMGADAVNALVEAAESHQYSVRARSIALRALGKLDFARLCNVAAPLMVRTARRAFEFFGRYDALRRAGAQDAGAVVLQRINRDYPMLTLEVVLEALTISGRLPPYEAIVVALNGGPSRERGFAVETVAQSSGRTLERLLAPWIAGWTPERQLAYARQHRLLPEMSKRESLDRSLASGFPLEAAAAAQALWERGEPQHLAAKLRELPHPILADTLRILEARAAGDGDVRRNDPG